MPLVRLLLAEDDPDHQDLLVSALTEDRPHVTVDVVDRGDRVVEVLRDAPSSEYDCLILDFNLPDHNAAELLLHLKKRSKSCPVVVISSSDAQGVVIASMRSGSVDFVPKSQALEGDTLWRRVELAIEEAQRRRETRRKIARRSHQLAVLAEQDPLTKLHNRRFIERLFDEGRTSLDRRGQTSLIMIDLDRFKRFNDQYGHACGDRVLQYVADRIRESLEAHHVACRWGGEEILLLLPGADLVRTASLAETLRQRIQDRSLALRAGVPHVTASLGVYACPGATLTRTTLPDAICRADEALYLAKQRRRNCVCTWEMVLFRQLIRQAELQPDDPIEVRLSKTIERGRHLLGETQYEHLTHHAQLVGRLADRLAEVMSVPPEQRHQIRVGGHMHDLGKFIVPESVIAKPGRLTPDERRLVDWHAAEGARMGLALGVDEATATCIEHHHTPYGPAAADSTVPLGARILSVADALVAMTSPRSYQASRPVGQALRELRRECGRQFDPAVVDALILSYRQDHGLSDEALNAIQPSRRLVAAGTSDGCRGTSVLEEARD